MEDLHAPCVGADGLEVLASIGLADRTDQLAATGAFRREPVPAA
jgi:hypothetical protein